ncbi:esterase, partial [Winogradskyella sp.]|nr:esterase [Winogradskyella sp.]
MRIVSVISVLIISALSIVSITFIKLENAVLAGGDLYRVENFPSQYITPRPVDVWLPDNYSEDKKYAVLYMHDGQNLFDSTTTWN